VLPKPLVVRRWRFIGVPRCSRISVFLFLLFLLFCFSSPVFRPLLSSFEKRRKRVFKAWFKAWFRPAFRTFSVSLDVVAHSTIKKVPPHGSQMLDETRHRALFGPCTASRRAFDGRLWLVVELLWTSNGSRLVGPGGPSCPRARRQGSRDGAEVQKLETGIWNLETEYWGCALKRP